MDLFKLVGSIFIKNEDANTAIDDTTGKAESFAKNLGSSMQSAGKSVTNMGKTFAPMSLMATGVLTACTKSGSDFTDGMAKMSTLFDTTKYSVEELSNQFVDLSNKSGLSATELAEAGYQALSAGQDVENVGKFVETAGNLAKAGFTDTSTAVDVLTTAMNAYGAEAGTAEQISNKLVRTQNLGKTTVNELASSMGKIIPTASAMHVDINNLTAGYVSLTKQGIATAESTTYMNGMLNELGKSSTQVGGILQEETGKSFQELMAEGNSLADVLGILQKHADEAGVGFNELWGSAEAGKAGLAILNGGIEDFNGTVDVMKSNTDDVGEALDKLNTPSLQAQKALNQIKNSAVTLGQTLLTTIAPSFTKVCDAISSATSWFNNLDDGTKKVILTILGVIAVVSPLLIGVGKFITFIGTVVTTIQTLIPVFGALNAVMMANPVALIVVAIVALIAIFVTLWNKCEGFRNFWKGLWNGIKTIVSGAVEGIKNFISGIGEKFTEMKENASEKWNSMKDTIANSKIGQVAGNVFDAMKDTVSQKMNNIKDAYNNAGGGLKGVTAGLWEGVKGQYTAGLTFIDNLTGGKLTAMKDKMSEHFNQFKEKCSGTWDNIKEKTSGVWDSIKENTSNAWSEIQVSFEEGGGGLAGVTEVAFDTVKNTVSGVLDFISEKTGLDLSAINDKFTEIWFGIRNFVVDTITGIKDKISEIWNNIKDKTSEIWDNVKTSVSDKITAVKDSISNGLKTAKDTVTSILNAIKTTFTNVWNTCKTTVSNGINFIKNVMKFEWELPKLKLPHFSVSGEFSLNPLKVPSFGIEWYKNGGILNDATMFGMNPFSGKAMVGGEAGAEAIAPLDTLLGYIRTAVAEQNASLIESFKESIHDLGDSLKDMNGDVVVPVYLGNNLIDELVVDSRKRVLLRSGGMTDV